MRLCSQGLTIKNVIVAKREMWPRAARNNGSSCPGKSLCPWTTLEMGLDGQGGHSWVERVFGDPQGRESHKQWWEKGRDVQGTSVASVQCREAAVWRGWGLSHLLCLGHVEGRPGAGTEGHSVTRQRMEWEDRRKVLTHSVCWHCWGTDTVTDFPGVVYLLLLTETSLRCSLSTTEPQTLHTPLSYTLPRALADLNPHAEWEADDTHERSNRRHLGNLCTNHPSGIRGAT